MNERRAERKKMRKEKVEKDILADIEAEFSNNPAKLALAQHMVDVGLPFAENIESDYTDKRALRIRKKEERNRLYKHLEANRGTAREFGFGVIGSIAFSIIVKQIAWWIASRLINYLIFGPEED